MDTLLRRRTAAPVDWLAEQARPDLDGRRRLVETCRAELVWARADWIEVARTAARWQDARLPHERAAARLLAVWGDLQPLEDRLHRIVERLRAVRRAGWNWRPTLGDLQGYRRERRRLWRVFLAAAADYRDARTGPGGIILAPAAAAGFARPLQPTGASSRLPDGPCSLQRRRRGV